MHHAAISALRADETVRLLASHGAPVNVVSHDGTTPLHWAARWGCAAVAVALVEAGAHLGARDAEGLTAVEVAVAEAKDDIAAVLRAAARRR